MPIQIIIGERLFPIKYHGQVKHVIFKCNECGNQFIKKESYFKKQLKKRKYACCFCSPTCRSKYFFDNPSTSNPPIKNPGFFSNIFQNFLK